MKRFSMTAFAIATGLMIVSANADAQKPQTDKEIKTQREQREAARERTARKPVTERSRAGKLDEKTTGPNLRASKLIGMNIQNPQGESVGEVHDLVIDTTNHKVKYAAVSYGGFLNLGDKLFAVPIEAIDCRQSPDDPEEHVLVMNVTQKQLEGAEGFDEDSWPNFADPVFTKGLDKRYGVERDDDSDVRRNQRRNANENELNRNRRQRRQPNEND